MSEGSKGRRLSMREVLCVRLADVRTDQAGDARGGGLLGPADPTAPVEGSYAQLVEGRRGKTKVQ